MPQNRKYFVHNSVHLITARTEEGLPLVPSAVLNLLIWSALAKGQSLYRVKVCHFIFMSNHLHMLAVVDDPEHLSAFVGYIKAETAHAVNRLLGRRRKTIWAEGYDSPAILTPEDVARYIAYIYSNPAKAGLVESIEQYPGVSSWEMYCSGKLSKTCCYLRRNQIEPLALPALSINEQRRLEEQLRLASETTIAFNLEPDAWAECFEGADAQRLNQDLRCQITENENAFREERRRRNKQVLGATALRRQSMTKEHSPKKFGKRMICICSDKELRKRYLSHFKALCARARQTFARWKTGDYSLPIPPGFFSPAQPIACCAVRLNL